MRGNELTTLQGAVVERLKGDPLLSRVEIIAEDEQDLSNRIEIAMAKLGACMVVGVATAAVNNPNLPGPQFDGLTFVVSVAENVMLNRTPGSSQLDALSLAMQAHRRLHHWRPVDTGFSNYTIYSARNAIEPGNSEDLLTFDANFKLGTT
ncbi:hypothetical protein EGM51_10635 [Verrucomicrobia bacterium S94]|nr:hypothetical protein EGM51_10635 [Verrucomicrobia bacterium S94]